MHALIYMYIYVHIYIYIYVCRFAVFQDAFDFSGQSGASEPLLNDSSLPVRYHVFLKNSTFIVVPKSP